jgi:hypothetical protein
MQQQQTHEPGRGELLDAVAFARDRLAAATEAYEQGGRTLELLRQKQVAEDELKGLVGEQRQYDDDRDVSALYRLDQRGRRTGRGMPRGPWKPERHEYVVSRTARVERVAAPSEPPVAAVTPSLPSAPPPRHAKEGRMSWWVGADRRTLNIGAKALAQAPPSKTARANAKDTIRQIVDRKRFETRGATPKLPDRPAKAKAAEGFAAIPLAE